LVWSYANLAKRLGRTGNRKYKCIDFLTFMSPNGDGGYKCYENCDQWGRECEMLLHLKVTATSRHNWLQTQG
jgi:hypothetical protein